jgi:hypothetical protein
MSKTSPAALAVLLNKTLPCRSYTPCIFLEISGMNLCSAAVSWIVLFFAVRSCNLLDRSGFPCVALHWLGSLCGFLDELASLDELIAPSGFKENGGGKKELARLRILLVSKTDNPHVSTRTPSNDKRRAEWWKLISLTRPWDRGRPAEPKPPHQAPPHHPPRRHGPRQRSGRVCRASRGSSSLASRTSSDGYSLEGSR